MTTDKQRIAIKITAKSFGTEYDPETYCLPDKGVVVTRESYSKAWVTLTWTCVDDFSNDIALPELKRSEIFGELVIDELNTQGCEIVVNGEGADTLKNDEEFQQMLDDEWCGDLFDYCLDHGRDVWCNVELPKNYDKDSIPEGDYIADRIRVYDIRVTWDDGTFDLFTFNKEMESDDKGAEVHIFDSEDSALQGFLKFISSI